QKATKAAISLADSVENACLIVFTRRGLAATQAAVLRPERAAIFAFSNDPVVVRQLALARDVTAFESPFLKDPARMISTALDLLKEKGLISSGQPVVIQGDSLQGELLADSIIFMRVE
ncbi:MAG: pyruvate kinase, partial [Akkermansia sp.]|nr:pyruvate kinase [Akkermansia sp.]